MATGYEIESAGSLEALFYDDNVRSSFPLLGNKAIESMIEGGYGKLGFAFGIEDPLGRVFTYPHKASAKDLVADSQWSVPSETVAGHFTEAGTLLEVETFEQCLTRCLLEEQGIDLREAPEEAFLFADRQIPLVFIEWQMDKEGVSPSTFAVSLALSANQAMAEYIALSAQTTEEAYQGFFQSIDFLEGECANGNIRPSFDLWLTQYTATSQKVSSEVDPEKVNIPPNLAERGEWYSLRFKQLRHQAGSLVLANFSQ